MLPLTETREIRDYAFEVKFLIDPALGQRIREWTRDRLPPDPYGAGPNGDEYRITTLYFDTPDYDVFRRQRSYARSKYRIRRYGQSDVAFLERKMRTSTLLSKRRTAVALEDLASLAADDLSAEWPGVWFQRRLAVRGLRPHCQVSYQRMARVGVDEHGPFRVTLDDQLTVKPADDLEFVAGAGAPLIHRGFILELKYRVTPPAILKQLVEEFALNPKRVSKYRLGVLALVDRLAGGASDLREANTIELRYA
ncbi:MAG TPA: polyphosphate polymerase domain-containing protein [Vicinamibacterales bacterium]|nr:polyphosphate polymerase domain-containing protein [Vicinamibacterales bacterium]